MAITKDWNAFRVTGLKGQEGQDGDLGVLTLSFSESTIIMQGNGQASGYVIYNNQKFYMNDNFTATTGGDGIIIADIRTNPATLLFKKLKVENDLLTFVDFNTGLNPITKADIDSIWEYLLVGEFSTLNDGTILNAMIKPIVSLSVFLSNEFTSILNKAAIGQADIESWAKAMGCDAYYNTLAVSKLFAGAIFAQAITLTDNGVIKSGDTEESVRIQADGLAKFKNLKIVHDLLTVFEVDSTNGDVLFGNNGAGVPFLKYEQESKSLKTLGNTFVLDSTGHLTLNSVDAIGGTFSGVLESASGFFKGQFQTATIRTEPGITEEHVLNLLIGLHQAATVFNYLNSWGYTQWSHHRCVVPQLPTAYLFSYNTIKRIDYDGFLVTFYIFTIYDADLNEIYKVRTFPNQIEGEQQVGTNQALTFTSYKGGDILYMENLPTSPPSEHNRVYVDNGTLKITE